MSAKRRREEEKEKEEEKERKENEQDDDQKNTSIMDEFEELIHPDDNLNNPTDNNNEEEEEEEIRGSKHRKVELKDNNNNNNNNENNENNETFEAYAWSCETDDLLAQFHCWPKDKVDATLEDWRIKKKQEEEKEEEEEEEIDAPPFTNVLDICIVADVGDDIGYYDDSEEIEKKNNNSLKKALESIGSLQWSKVILATKPIINEQDNIENYRPLPVLSYEMNAKVGQANTEHKHPWKWLLSAEELPIEMIEELSQFTADVL